MYLRQRHTFFFIAHSYAICRKKVRLNLGRNSVKFLGNMGRLSFENKLENTVFARTFDKGVLSKVPLHAVHVSQNLKTYFSSHGSLIWVFVMGSFRIFRYRYI